MKPEDSFLEFVLDQLSELRRVTNVRLFGAWGLYFDDVFFGIVDQGRLYFKTNETTRGDYEAQGMGPLRISETEGLWSYYEVPVDVLEDSDALVGWARKAIEVQRVEMGRKKSRKKKKR